MIFKSILPVCLSLMLSACAIPSAPGQAPLPISRFYSLGALSFLNELSRVATLTPEQRRREITALDNERHFDDAKRFQLAALLEREDSADALERSLKTLAAIEGVDARAQMLLDLMKRSLTARIELRQQTARAQELQDKLEQIKALEKTLQQRNALPKSP